MRILRIRQTAVIIIQPTAIFQIHKAKAIQIPVKAAPTITKNGTEKEVCTCPREKQQHHYRAASLEHLPTGSYCTLFAQNN